MFRDGYDFEELTKELQVFKSDLNIHYHNENPGVLELVFTKIHHNVKHTGGKQIWGGGVHSR